MEISSIDQEVTDFDWYAVDPDGYVIQFASGGGPLPGSVAASCEALTQLHDYFLSLSPETTTAHLNPRLVQVEPYLRNDEDAYGRYVHSFVNYGKRGLYAFNKTDLAHQDNRYHLVAYPEIPLLLAALPPHISALLSRTRVPFAVSRVDTVDANAIQ